MRSLSLILATFYFLISCKSIDANSSTKSQRITPGPIVEELHRLALARDFLNLRNRLKAIPTESLSTIRTEHDRKYGISFEWLLRNFPSDFSSIKDVFVNLVTPPNKIKERFTDDQLSELLRYLKQDIYLNLVANLKKLEPGSNDNKTAREINTQLALLGEEDLEIVRSIFKESSSKAFPNLGSPLIVTEAKPVDAKTIAMIVSSRGYHWEEVYGAYAEFVKEGFTVHLFTPEGVAPRPDAVSLMLAKFASKFGLGLSPEQLPTSRVGQMILEDFSRPVSISELDPKLYTALYLPGGHGSYHDLNRNPKVHRIVQAFYDKGKVIGAVCHATSTIGGATKNDRQSIIAGRRVTGFPSTLDDLTLKAGVVLKEFDPPFDNDEELAKYSADNKLFQRKKALVNYNYAIVDTKEGASTIVSGVGPKAADDVARLMVKQIRVE